MDGSQIVTLGRRRGFRGNSVIRRLGFERLGELARGKGG